MPISTHSYIDKIINVYVVYIGIYKINGRVSGVAAGEFVAPQAGDVETRQQGEQMSSRWAGGRDQMGAAQY